MNRWRIIVAVLAALLIALALVKLAAQTAGLEITRYRLGPTPVTVFADPAPPPGPAVVIAHGFAGSQQLMAPIATNLARSGLVAVTYDLLGHGGNAAPLAGDVVAIDGATASLVAELARVTAFARDLPEVDGRAALVAHSMASDIAVRAAVADPSIAATAAISMFSPAVTPDLPKNLLVIAGAWESRLRPVALDAVSLATGAAAEPATTYGDPAEGTARRAVFAPSVEHVGVLYSPTTLSEIRDWMAAAFARPAVAPPAVAPPDARAPWLAVYFAATLALAWSLAPLLPEAAGLAVRARRLGRRRLALAVLGPALLAPLVAVPIPFRLVPVPVADYLLLHFPLYGLLTALLAWPFLRATPRAVPLPAFAATLAVAAFALFAVYLPLDLYVAAMIPPAHRLGLVAALALAILPYFLADELLTRAPDRPRAVYLLTKLAFLLSLGLAIGLAPDRLFFLALILPVVVLFFLLFGLISRWSARATGHPLPGAVANALLFAWAIGTTFPILGS